MIMNHKIHQRLVSTVFLLTISLSVFGQNSTNSIFEYGIEVGAGYNQLFMQSDSPAMHNRTAFSVMPSVRMFIGLNPTSHFGLYTFAGYNEFGGRDSGDYPAGGVKFSSEVNVQALDFGLFGLFRVSDFRFGMGAKYNHHVSVSDRYDYFGSASANWDWRYYDVFFASISRVAGGYDHTTFVSDAHVQNNQNPENITNTYIHAGVGLSTFGPTLQFGAHYRPGPYALNFRLLTSFSDDNAFLYSANTHIDVIYGKTLSFNSFMIEGGLGISAVFVSARPGAYSGGIVFNSQPTDAGFEGFQTGISHRASMLHNSEGTGVKGLHRGYMPIESPISNVEDATIEAFQLGFQPDQNEIRFAVGIPIDIQFAWDVTSRLRLAIHTFTNLNTISINTGMYTSVQWRLPRQTTPSRSGTSQ